MSGLGGMLLGADLLGAGQVQQGNVPTVFPAVENIGVVSPIERTDPLTYRVYNENGVPIVKTLIWVKLLQNPQPARMVYDGTGFLDPFDVGSTVTPGSDQTDYLIKHNDLWEDDIGAVVFAVVDDMGRTAVVFM